MNLHDNDRDIELSGDAVNFLMEYAISVMDAHRKAAPEYAWCWNVCRIIFDGSQPSFVHGGNEPDVEAIDDDKDKPSVLVWHPKVIDEPSKGVKRGK